MWNIVKSLFRYSSKNILSITMLSVLLTVASTVFGSLNFLSTNLNNSYNFLVNNGNLNNVVINELYSATYVDPITQKETTGEQAKLLNKQAFEKELSQLIGKENFRSFEAIDFSNVNSSSGGFIYKIVNNPNDVIIDKTVIYSGQNVLNQTFDFDQLIIDSTIVDPQNDIYDPSKSNSQQAIMKAQARRLVVFLATKALWTNYNKDVNNFLSQAKELLKNNDLNSQTYDPANIANSSQGSSTKLLYNKIDMWCNVNNKHYTPLTSKGYRLAFDFAGPPNGATWVPLVGKIDNLNAYTCVASPSTIKIQQKQIISKAKYDELVNYNEMYYISNKNEYEKYNYNYSISNYIDERQILDLVAKSDNNSTIEVDNLRYFIVGSGISPNFMYPVYSFERQTPNINSEGLIYANDAGYNLAFDSARSSPIESYIVAKVDDDEINKIVNQINTIAQKYMIWPNPLKAAYEITDTANTQSPSALRVVFIPELVKTQTAISTILSIFLLALVLMIFIFTIKKFINDLRIPLGILRANGVSKRTIVFAMPILCLIPSLASSLIGYLITQFTQNTFLGLYSFYWTIPTPIIAFSPLMFFGLLLVPFAVMSIIAMIYTYIILKTNAASLMRESMQFKATPLSRLVSKIIPKGNILVKFRISVAFSSIPKLTMITIMFSLLMVSIYLGIGLDNKFNYVKNLTFKNKNYNFSVDLIQPSVQGGQYFRQQTNYPGRVVLNDKNQLLNFNIGMSDKEFMIFKTYSSFRMQTPNRKDAQNDSLIYIEDNINLQSPNNFKYDNFRPKNPIQNPSKIAAYKNINGLMLLNHLPSGNDADWQKSDFNYLNYKLEVPATVNAVVGAGTATANPWDIARNLAPMNQITLANNKYKKMWYTIFSDNNIYFNEQSLINNGISGKDISKMNNKPLNQIVKEYGFIKQNYDNNLPEGNKLPNGQKNMLKVINEDTIEIYDPNDPKIILQQWYVDYGTINNTATIKYPYALIMTTLMNLNNKDYTNPQFINEYNNLLPEQKENLNLEYIKNYKDCFFNMFYSYIPMNETDETYTNVETYIDNQKIILKGFKPNSAHLKLQNAKNEIINDKLRLENINENEYTQDLKIQSYNQDGSICENNLTNGLKSIHEIYSFDDPNDYASSLINKDKNNFKVIINESAAYKFGLKIGDIITIDPKTEATNATPGEYNNLTKASLYNQINNTTYNFKVVDIVTTYQSPEFYINQRVANYINGMALPSIVNQSFYNEQKANTLTTINDWYDYYETTTIKAIDPFNGYFSLSDSPDLIDNLSLYSQSGLAPGNDKFSKTSYYEILIENVMNSTPNKLSSWKDQSSYISKMTLANALGLTVAQLDQKYPFSKDKNANKQQSHLIIDDLISIYGESPLLSSSIYIEPIQTFSELFVNVGNFVNSLFVLILIIIFLLTILSIYYLAIDFINSGMGLIAMMRAFGFKNDENVFSFLSIFFPAIIISFAISFVAIPIFAVLKSFIFSFANILLPISLQWWYVLIGLVVSFGMLAITLLIALFILKKTNPAKAITR